MKGLIKDPIQYAVEVVGADPFAKLLGIKVEDARDSYARMSLVVKEEYCNSEGRTHGGVLFTLADQAFAVAANSRGYAASCIHAICAHRLKNMLSRSSRVLGTRESDDILTPNRTARFVAIVPTTSFNAADGRQQ